MWFCPLREALDGFIDVTQKEMDGTVKLKLYKGNCMVVASKSPNTLYSEDFVTFGEDDVYNQRDADGFINLFALPLTIKAILAHEKKAAEGKENK